MYAGNQTWVRVITSASSLLFEKGPPLPLPHISLSLELIQLDCSSCLHLPSTALTSCTCQAQIFNRCGRTTSDIRAHTVTSTWATEPLPSPPVFQLPSTLLVVHLSVIFEDSFSLCSPGCSRTHSVDQADLKFWD